MKLLSIIACVYVSLIGFDGIRGHSGGGPSNETKVFSLDDLEVKAKGLINSVFLKILPSVLRNSNGKVSLDCNIALIRLTMGIRKLDGWALRVLDSSGKPPGGIMKGTLTAFGSYDECVDIEVPSKSARSKEAHFRGKYCSIQLHPPDGLFSKTKETPIETSTTNGTIVSQFKKYGAFLASAYLRFGVCVPAACNETDLHQLSQSILDQMELPAKIKIRRCEVKQSLNFSSTHISVMTIVGVLIVTLFAGSFFDALFNKRRTIWIRLVTSFSFRKNIEELLTVERSCSEIGCLDGIRFVTSLWIILGHTYLLPLGVHYTRFRNVSQFVKFQRSFSFAAIGNFYLSVDTFFFIRYFVLLDIILAGTVWAVKGRLLIPARISPVYFFTIGLFVLLPLLGSGPFWYDAVESQADICYKYWWASLLYIQNFWPIKENCMLHSWYLAATLQIHVVSFFIIWPMLKFEINLKLIRKIDLAGFMQIHYFFAVKGYRPAYRARSLLIQLSLISGNYRLGLFVNSLVLVTSVFLTGFVTFWYGLKPTMDVLGGHATLDGITSYIYIRPYSHLPTFCVGIFFGAFLVFKDKVVVPKVLVILGSLVALAINILVIYGLHDYYKSGQISSIESVLYAALHRPSWALSIGWLVFLCVTGNLGFINRILSWNAFAPLAKLSFAAYLIHPLIILYQLGSSRERIYLGHFEMIMNSISVSCVSYVIALFLHVGIEVPCLKIEKLILARLSKEDDSLPIKEVTIQPRISIILKTAA